MGDAEMRASLPSLLDDGAAAALISPPLLTQRNAMGNTYRVHPDLTTSDDGAMLAAAATTTSAMVLDSDDETMPKEPSEGSQSDDDQ